jgi:hypothetical protein
MYLMPLHIKWHTEMLKVGLTEKKILMEQSNESDPILIRHPLSLEARHF